MKSLRSEIVSKHWEGEDLSRKVKNSSAGEAKELMPRGDVNWRMAGMGFSMY